MSTQKTTIEFLLLKLGNNIRFRTQAMFGEYALNADNKVVGLICNDQLYLKILPASQELETRCETDSPYEGAKKQYVIEEQQYDTLSGIVIKIAESLPELKKKSKK